MQKIEVIKFKKYFFKNFERLEEHIKDTFYKKLELIENGKHITKKLHYKEHIHEIRCLRIGKFRFIFILKDNIATFLDVMYRELGYKNKYINNLITVYENGE